MCFLIRFSQIDYADLDIGLYFMTVIEIIWKQKNRTRCMRVMQFI